MPHLRVFLSVFFNLHNYVSYLFFPSMICSVIFLSLHTFDSISLSTQNFLPNLSKVQCHTYLLLFTSIFSFLLLSLSTCIQTLFACSVLNIQPFGFQPTRASYSLFMHINTAVVIWFLLYLSLWLFQYYSI